MRCTVARIDLGALRWNLSQLRHRTEGRKIMAMVKANAYGHGMIEVSRTLQESGVDMLGVAFADEGVTLREQGIVVPIMVLTPTMADEARIVVDNALTTVACDFDQVATLGTLAAEGGTKAIVHVYVDTGMHRDGVQPHEAVDFVHALDRLPGIDVQGICTHFATSDEAHSGFLLEQLESFRTVVATLSSAGRTFVHVHAANTGAIWQAEQALCTMVRPGLSLYGYAPPFDDAMTMRPVLSLETKVLSVRRIRAGETVSYGRRYTAPADRTIATIPVGYGDGYPRKLTGKATCLINGRSYPVVGTICMDECMVDVGDDPVAIGDDVVLIGRQADVDGRIASIDATDVAAWAETIPYEITTAITARVPRKYV